MSRFRPAEGWSSLVLLILMSLIVAWSIEAADWAPGLALLQAVVIVGIVAGFVLSELPIPGLVAHWFSTLVGIAWSAVLTSRLLSPTTITYTKVLPDEGALTWQIRFTELAYRIWRFIETARGGGVGQDNLVFVLQMAILMWLVSYASAWFLFRLRSVWGAIVPSGFAMLLNLYYAPPTLYTWMALYLLCALLLIVRSNVFLQEWEWQQAGVGYAPDISFDFLRDGVIFAVIVILVAWIAPTTSAMPRLYAIVDRFNEPVYRFQREFNRLYSSLNYQPQPGPAYFGDTLALLGPVNLGDTPVFDAVTEKGRYWRGVVYDQYTGRGWVNTATSITVLADDDPRLQAAQDFQLRETVTQTIRVLQPGMTQIHTLPQPIDVSLPVRVEYSPIPETRDDGVRPLNVSIIQSRRPLEAGETYVALSSLSMADVQSLRQAGTDYPDWVKEKYLQLPEDLPQRVRDLAVKITAGKDNPYDKVTALESYLRQIKYDEKIPAPPPGVDAVDWFLFEQRAGYCDYYASALIVMARVLGIPARLAAGYSRGEYEPEIGAYRQREYDAHSWPEVFFPKYGWIEFEPTAADPRIIRPSAPSVANSTDSPSDSNPKDDLRNERLPDEELFDPGSLGPGTDIPALQRRKIGLWASGILGALALAGVVGWLLWLRAFRGLSLAGGVYARMVRLAEWLGLSLRPSQTPHEFAGQLVGVVPEGQPAIEQITDAYVLERYAEVPPGEEEASALQEAWSNLRRVLVERIGVRLLQRIKGAK